MEETLYSKNGEPPVGNRKVTHYSSSPDDTNKMVHSSTNEQITKVADLSSSVTPKNKISLKHVRRINEADDDVSIHNYNQNPSNIFFCIVSEFR